MLTNNQIELVIQTIINGFAPDKIILFGSYADGTATENSDLDLAIIKETNIPAAERSWHIKKLFRGASMKFPMDIVVLNHNELEKDRKRKYTLAYEINNKGKILYDRYRISA